MSLTQRIAVAVVAILAGTPALLASCTVAVEVEGKQCSSTGACGSGFECDRARNVCVRLGTVPAATSDPLPAGAAACDPCACEDAKDCKDPLKTQCGPSKQCVECTREPDTCPEGRWCNPQHQCTLGCKTESDCEKLSPGTHCNLDRHQCVGCVTNAHCTAPEECSPSGTCDNRCDPAVVPTTCTSGACCGGFCIDTTSDPLNCGSCGTRCPDVNGAPRCERNTCGLECAAGFATCPGKGPCETNTTNDAKSCGACGADCAVQLANVPHVIDLRCAQSRCGYGACEAGWWDCDPRVPGCECDETCGNEGQGCCGGKGGSCKPGLTCGQAGANGTCNAD